MIRIMKASAGSGKTYNLAKTYIRLFLTDEERYSYRHILAVTFTNKATDEMKNRILKELNVLSTDTSGSPYFDDLLPLFGSEEKLRKRSSTVLCDILHDYGAFAVSTIDRFFQQTLKAFSREIGQFSSYQVELDKDSLVKESVDRVLDSLTADNKELLSWLTKLAMEDLEKGDRYNLENKLNEMALNLKSDEHREAVEKYGIDEDAEYSKDNLEKTGKALSKIVADFEKDAKDAAAAFVKAAGEGGLASEDFSRSCFKSVYAEAEVKLKDGLIYPTDAVLNKQEDYGTWFKKADRPKYAHLEGILMPLLQNYCSLLTGPRYRAYLTAGKIRKILGEMGIASDLYREFAQLMKEKNVLSIDDSNVILRNIIDGTDAPFIYEKLGVRFEHFLLDEFQDTSRIQWDNFRPLIANSVAQGRENLIVGDVKQSIYRWRGSDWRMMAKEVQDEFTESGTETLDSNYRSLRNIVEFNNAFFEYAPKVLDSMLGESPDGVAAYKVADIYADESQAVKSKDSAEGSVEVIFRDKDSILEEVLAAVRRVNEAGARLGEITVLVRKNKQGGEVARYLMDNGVSVITDDSLSLKSSAIVRRTVSLISSVGNEEDSIGSFLAGEMGLDVRNISYISLSDLCERILRLLKAGNTELFESETQYIQSFMDFVQDYVSAGSNALDGFLKAWQDSDPKISSPSDSDSVRVMTVHKSKGLEFSHVIFPYAEGVEMFRKGTSRWAKPDVKGTELEGVTDGVYHVTLSQPKNEQSLFTSESFAETQYQYIDNINTLYVALTRAVRGLTVIAALPSKKCLDAVAGMPCLDVVPDGIELPDGGFSDFSQVLYCYLRTRGAALGYSLKEEDGSIAFSKGTLYDYTSLVRTEAAVSELMPGYPSFPLNPETEEDADADVRERGRLKISADSVDFFLDGAREEARLNGTVLHGILSEVRTPSDVPVAVRRAFEAGDIDAGREDEYLNILTKAVGAHPEWFPADGEGVFNETQLIDTDGEIRRPDRVLVRNGKVTVIDYKFGGRNPRYARQVARYADIYRRMGYPEISASIWYVLTDEVEQVVQAEKFAIFAH